MSNLRRIALYWQSVRHLKAEQVVGRLVEGIRGSLGSENVPGPPSGLQPSSASLVPDAPTCAGGLNSATAEAVASGTFVFLNERRDLGRPVDWQPDAPPLWQFNLHYFGYLHFLDEQEQQAFCREWVEANPVGAQPGWHPYPTSLRVINWCKAGIDEPDLLGSLYQQAAYLYRHLETHLLGNHLLENARALVFAGCFFEGQGEAPEWKDKGLDIYREQTPEQVLADGGHFERSPMYHALVLEGYLDVLNLLPADHPDYSLLAGTARRMGDFLVSVTHPNGRLALFNDATREIAVPTQRLSRYSENVIGYEPVPRCSFPDTGYFIHRDDDCYLVIDGGPIGPNYLPAHAHADIFSYELSVDGTLFVVDTGVYEYEAGAMRDYVRSTEAHNTVCVDGIDQAECWDSFRVARRYAPRDVSFEQHDHGSVFEGTFEGYAHLIGDQIEHRRRIEVDEREKCITVEDAIGGRGQHSVESRIHLHPEVKVQQNRETIQVRRDGRTVQICTGDSTVRMEKGWYCPEFGTRMERDVVVLKTRGVLPTDLSYRIHY